MKTQKFLFAVMLVFASVTTLRAETADEIINKHNDAIGGKATWKGIKTLHFEGTSTAQGMEIKFALTAIQNKASRMDITLMGMTGYTIVTPTAGWAFFPFNGQKQPEAMTADDIKQTQDELDIQGELIDYKEKGNSVELLGKEDVEGTECWKLKVTYKSGKIRTDFIDPETFYIIRHTDKQIANGQEHESSTNFSNFKKLPEGITVPMTIGAPQGEITIKKVEINSKIDESLFKVG